MDRKFKKYDISHYTKISFSGLTSVNDINKLKYNFSVWLLSCCFRELIEHLDMFFSKICNILEPSKDYNDKKFKFKDRLDLIVKHLHNPPPKPVIISHQLMPTFFTIRSDGILSLQHIRNCLVHRAGVVGKEDAKNGELNLIWYAVHDRYKRSADKKLIIDSRYDKRPRSFKLGETIKLSPRELHQIAAFLLDEVFTICNAMNQKYKIYTKPVIFNQDANRLNT